MRAGSAILHGPWVLELSFHPLLRLLNRQVFGIVKIAGSIPAASKSLRAFLFAVTANEMLHQRLLAVLKNS